MKNKRKKDRCLVHEKVQDEELELGMDFECTCPGRFEEFDVQEKSFYTYKEGEYKRFGTG